MKEIAVSDLRVSDIGSRAIAIDQSGNAYDGILTDVRATDWKYGKRPEEMVRARITIKSGEASELQLTELPLDFRIQVERAPAPSPPTPEQTGENR
jgi:hypothetical protein